MTKLWVTITAVSNLFIDWDKLVNISTLRPDHKHTYNTYGRPKIEFITD